MKRFVPKHRRLSRYKLPRTIAAAVVALMVLALYGHNMGMNTPFIPLQQPVKPTGPVDVKVDGSSTTIQFISESDD